MPAGGKVRVRAPGRPADDRPGATQAMPALPVAGLIVAKADLLQFLRGVVPGLRDLAVDESGETFYLLLGAREETDEDPTAG